MYLDAATSAVDKVERYALAALAGVGECKWTKQPMALKVLEQRGDVTLISVAQLAKDLLGAGD